MVARVRAFLSRAHTRPRTALSSDKSEQRSSSSNFRNSSVDRAIGRNSGAAFCADLDELAAQPMKQFGFHGRTLVQSFAREKSSLRKKFLPLFHA